MAPPDETPSIRMPDERSAEGALFTAAFMGYVRRFKAIARTFADPAVVLSINLDGIGLLDCAACAGHLDICKYLVEELRADVNASGWEGVTPFMNAAQSGDVPIVKYFLARGGDLMKVDDNGCTALHHAVVAGRCNATEFLLSKGAPVDIECGRGSPLYLATTKDQDSTLKILLKHHANPNTIVNGSTTPLIGAIINHSLKCFKILIKAGADVNGDGALMPPLVFAAWKGGYTNFIQFLLKAGADPNIPDDEVISVLKVVKTPFYDAIDEIRRSHYVPFQLGRLPVELAALRDCMEEVEMLFPLTSPTPNVPDWSVDGIISHAKIENAKPLDQSQLERRQIVLKSRADDLFKLKDYKTASKFYGWAIDDAPCAKLYANRSLCRLLMGDGEGALSDALRSRSLRPNWAKAFYREAAAHMLLKEYKKARDVLLDAQKLDPASVDIERELRKATELMKEPDGDDAQ